MTERWFENAIREAAARRAQDAFALTCKRKRADGAVLYTADGVADTTTTVDGVHLTGTPLPAEADDDVLEWLAARYGSVYELVKVKSNENDAGNARYVVKIATKRSGDAWPDEVRALLRLLSPTFTHVNKLQALVVADERVFMVTPNVFGRDLTKLPPGHFAAPGAADVFLAHMREAVASLWRARLFHADVVANNILYIDLSRSTEDVAQAHYTLIDYDHVVFVDEEATSMEQKVLLWDQFEPRLTPRFDWRLAYALSMAPFLLTPYVRTNPELAAAVQADVIGVYNQAFGSDPVTFLEYLARWRL